MGDPPHKAHLVSVETIHAPGTYTPDQIREAFDIAICLNRGKLILTATPRGDHATG